MSDTIRSSVDAILAENGVSFLASCMGETTRDNWQCDEWRVTFSRGKESETFQYFTGLGHRVETEAYRLAMIDLKNANPRCLARVEAEKLKKPKAPHAADVIYSLALDGQFANGTFEDFCDNLGYDTDSRKALEGYLQCQKDGERFRRIVGTAAFNALGDVVQDY
jgi:hypothetical protein